MTETLRLAAPEVVDITTIAPHPENYRNHSTDLIRESLLAHGQTRSVVCQRSTRLVLAGNGVYAEMVGLGYAEILVSWVDVDDETARRIVVVDNRAHDQGWDDEGQLAALLADIAEGGDWTGTGYDAEAYDELMERLAHAGTAGDGEAGEDGASERESSRAGALAERFMVPPFSVLDARRGYWQERRRYWLSLGIESEQGRGGNLLGMSDTILNGGFKAIPGTDMPSDVPPRFANLRKRSESLTLPSPSGSDPTYYPQKKAAEKRLGRALSNPEFEAEHYQPTDGPANLSRGGTSVFDPVLCELVYRWFCPPDGRVLDPFAGGSVRGVVAAALGRSYLGIDLSEPQLEANRAQWQEIAPRLLRAAENGSQPPAEAAEQVTPTGASSEVPPAPEPLVADEPASAMKPWQKGVPMERLKAISAVFAAHDEGLILGAFTAYKETAVADALDRQALDLLEDDDSGICAVAETMRKAGAVTDFAGNEIGRATKEQPYIKRLAYAAGREEDAVTLLEGYAAGEMWCEIFQEHSGDRLIMEALEMRWVGSKIRASSEIIGVYASPSVAANETSAADQATLARLEQAPMVEFIEVLAEAADGLELADHYSGYNKGHAWTALSLRGYSDDPTFIIKPSEMAKKWREENASMLEEPLRDTPLREQLPQAEPLIAAIPGEKHRIRLMMLAPGGGELTRHADITDKDAGTAPGKLLRIHIPLRTNHHVRFTMWNLLGERVGCHMALGEAWYLDTRKPHTAVNDGLEPRLHLVMDVESSPELLALLGEEAAPL